MQDIIDNSKVTREVTQATKRREKLQKQLQKQLKECKEYDERIAHIALARISIDLDDGVKVN
jgi:septal ring factor EnvC (AmiA/AmiB activator)